MKFLNFFLLLYSSFLISCIFVGKNKSKDDGLSGNNKTKKEASESGYETYLYVADKNTFNLLDNTTVKIDTARTKVYFTYKNGEKVIKAPHGFVFSIPFKKSVLNTFTFTFSLLDITNRAFTNGISEDLCQVYPQNLKDEIKIILKQKHINPSIGWIKPSVTDTITYKRLTK